MSAFSFKCSPLGPAKRQMGVAQSPELHHRIPQNQYLTKSILLNYQTMPEAIHTPIIRAPGRPTTTATTITAVPINR